MKSSELLVQTKNNSWRVVEGYWAQLDHTLMGTFPALTLCWGKKEGEMFMCLEKETLEKVLLLLPRRRFKIKKELLLVQECCRTAFSLSALVYQYDLGQESESVHILTSDDILAISNKPNPDKRFKWAPGLIGDDMSLAEFRETLKHALAKT